MGLQTGRRPRAQSRESCGYEPGPLGIGGYRRLPADLHVGSGRASRPGDGISLRTVNRESRAGLIGPDQRIREIDGRTERTHILPTGAGECIGPAGARYGRDLSAVVAWGALNRRQSGLRACATQVDGTGVQASGRDPAFAWGAQNHATSDGRKIHARTG